MIGNPGNFLTRVKVAHSLTMTTKGPKLVDLTPVSVNYKNFPVIRNEATKRELPDAHMRICHTARQSAGEKINQISAHCLPCLARR
ncbi:hypothetical protein CEXT_485141 [Caerostris extrusa]|uniref:Uncharacterized protein n=1 Tax=Caerostris extrusa TaxID=172846 RepID=A0AAV4Q7M1_CAEEX|nr:hypothetical protein CEXT_485141 [Caerostris extrusa]